jgi:hypothetical protein
VFTSNDFPDHPTGRFPIARDDPAYWCDRNPNRITPQSIHIELPANPKLTAQPRCAPAAVGILLTGVALFNALDAPGRGALAHETQDRCQGHSQRGGVYHYLSADLDACYGFTSVIDWDGRKVKMCHYVATADFPYTVGYLRGDYDRSLVRAIAGAPPGRGGFGRPGRLPGPPGPPVAALDYFPRGALMRRITSQIGITITAPSRK